MSQHQQQQTMSRTRTEQHGKQVLHVQGDSNSNVDDLFKVLEKDDFGKIPPQTNPLKSRNLPASFFRPPEPKGQGASPCPVNGYGPCVHRMCEMTGGLTVSQGGCCGGHGRSVSSPAQLAHPTLQPPHPQPPCSSPVTPGGSSAHNKQASLDGTLLEEFTNSSLSTMRPTAWGDKSQRYYLNNWQQQQQTTDLPSPSHPPQSQLHYTPHQPNMLLNPSNLHHHHHHHPTSGNFSQQQDSCTLPTGWEQQRMAQENEMYFHAGQADKTANWFDPRMPRMMQSMRLQQSQKQQQQLQQQQQHIQQQQQGMCGSLGHHHHHHHHQQQQQQHGTTGCAPNGARRASSNEHYFCLELQKLQREKERLQQEQEAIACREMLLNEMFMQTTGSTPMDGGAAGGAAGLGTGTLGGAGGSHPQHQTDGYLGGTGGQALPTITSIDSHVRQNSTDSGLGGMGTAYSLPRSPEDYYGQIEEMSVDEANGKLQGLCYGGGTGDMLYGSHHRLDMASVSELADRAGVDADQLVASLGEDYQAILMNKTSMKDCSLPWM